MRGRKVALVGRLASMSHPEARQRVASAGGEMVPAADADLLVAGEGSVRRESAHSDSGAIETIDEVAFLCALGMVPEEPLYGLSRLAALLEVEPRRLRSWVRRDLLRPARVVGRLCLFDFRSVALARRLARLCATGVGTTRIRRSLDRARRWLPTDEAGADALEAPAPSRVAVRLTDGRLAEPDGQLLMDFEGRKAPEPATALRHPAPLASGGDAERWFELAVAAEAEGRWEEAVTCYRRSLDLAEEPETWFNLGNCLCRLDDRRDSVAAYRRALELDGDYAEAWNNLGNVLGELGEEEEAVTAYRRALGISPWYSDARHNLAETLRDGPGEDR